MFIASQSVLIYLFVYIFIMMILLPILRLNKTSGIVLMLYFRAKKFHTHTKTPKDIGGYFLTNDWPQREVDQLNSFSWKFEVGENKLKTRATNIVGY